VGSFQSKFRQETYGFYAQDLIDVTKQVKVLAGIRYDIADEFFQRSLNTPFAGIPMGFPTTATDSAEYRWSPRVGLIYQPVEEMVSFYGSYSQSFDPPSGGNFRNLTPLEPELGHSREGGLKLSLMDMKLNIEMAGFYIEKTNVITQDNLFFATQIGKQRSQGFEASAVGQVNSWWSLIANYAYVDSRILNDPDPTIRGNRFRNVPYNSANLWSRVNLVDDCTRTIGVALGLVAEDSRPGDLQNSFALPSFIRWDAGLYYRQGLLNASLYLENLFDRRYYASSVDQFTIYPGAPFTVRGYVGITF
jgi:iron complex outermembrane receptor protein